MNIYKQLGRTPSGTRKIKISKKLKEQIYKKYNYKCVDCGNKAQVTHHLIPIWEDRTKAKDINNIIPLCWDCHLKRHYVYD